MIAGLDSSFFRPSRDTALAAKAAGVQLWWGYLASRARVGLASAWSPGDFDNARLCGSTPIAYCSGYDDPVACMTLAKAWNVKLCLDVEAGGLRGDGPWVQSWIDTAGRGATGLYGNYGVFANRSAAFYVVGGYPGYDPRRIWGYVADPGGPCGWQWLGSHDEFGGGVDRGWFHDSFAQGSPPAPPEEEPMAYVIQGSDKPTVWITDGLSRRYIGNMDELSGWLRTTKRPLEKKPQYDVDRIPVSWRNPEDLTGTGLINYDTLVFGPQRQLVSDHPAMLTAALPEQPWMPSDEEVKKLHSELGFYPVVGADHKA